MKPLFTFFLLFLCIKVNSQTSGMNNAIKMRLEERNGDRQIHAMLVEGKISELQSLASRYNFIFNYSSGDIASITCSLKELSRLIEDKIITYAELTEAHKQILNDTMVVRNRIKAVKKWTAPL